MRSPPSGVRSEVNLVGSDLADAVTLARWIGECQLTGLTNSRILLLLSSPRVVRPAHCHGRRLWFTIRQSVGALLGAEGAGEQLRVIDSALVMQIAHGRADIGVTHPCLDLDDARNIDAQRTKCVAKVVEAQASQAGSLDRGEIAAAQSRPIEMHTVAADEHEVFLTRVTAAVLEVAQRLGDLIDHWYDTRLAGLGLAKLVGA